MVAPNKLFSARIVVSATNEIKARQHQTELPNALPTSERCPGQPKDMVEDCFTLHTWFAFGHGGDHSGYVSAKGSAACVAVNFINSSFETHSQRPKDTFGHFFAELAKFNQIRALVRQQRALVCKIRALFLTKERLSVGNERLSVGNKALVCRAMSACLSSNERLSVGNERLSVGNERLSVEQ